MDENKVDFEKMTPAERLKYEVAEEIGLADKVRQYGWRSLTAKESGRIGGLMTKKRRRWKQDKERLIDICLKTPKALENKGKIQYFQGLSNLPAAGLEPARCCHQWILSPPRLPFRQAGCLSTLLYLTKIGDRFALFFCLF